jgi:nucleoside 2-deoxyribosyltransferase
MKIFIAASYSSQVNYETGAVFPEYKKWLEENLTLIEQLGHTVFCALRADGYRINDSDPAQAFSLDLEQIRSCDGMLAFISEKPSIGVQTEVGVAVALGKQVALASEPTVSIGYFNDAMVRAQAVQHVTLPLSEEKLRFFKE